MNQQEETLTAPLRSPPFNAARLDHLMEAADVDLLIVSSKHNVQYLLGGHRSFFFDYMDAIGIGRYMPLFIYPKGRPDLAGYVGNEMESYENELNPFWVRSLRLQAWTPREAIRLAMEHLRFCDVRARRIGVELAFLPAEADAALRSSFPDSEITDALLLLERLRARKTPEELALLRQASELVVDAMLAVISSHGEGTTKKELTLALRREEVSRDLTFEYCLVAMGTNFNRAASEQAWRAGEILSLDSGGNLRGYIGDLARMAVLGEPDAELEELLAEVDAIQLAARQSVRQGVPGGEIFAVAAELLAQSSHRRILSFVAHGMGLISHEAPRLTASGPVPYPADDADRPLEAGMVLSIETTLQHPRRGFIKLEDTVAVTEDGYEAFGDRGRGWNRAV